MFGSPYLSLKNFDNAKFKRAKEIVNTAIKRIVEDSMLPSKSLKEYALTELMKNKLNIQINNFPFCMVEIMNLFL